MIPMPPDLAALQRGPTTVFATREGVKVYGAVPAERRVGYSWYGTWGGKVLKKYPEWHRKLGK